MGRLNINTNENQDSDLAFICDLVKRNKTEVVVGLIEAYAARLRDQVARGYYAAPAPGGSVAAAIQADQLGHVDLPAPGG